MEKIPISSNDALIASCESWDLSRIIDENHRRMDAINAHFDPYSGKNSIGERECVCIQDFPIQKLWLPKKMVETPLVQGLAEFGFYGFIEEKFKIRTSRESDYRPTANMVLDIFRRTRNRYDFPWWCYMYVPISQKGGGDDVRFRLNIPQRKLMGLWNDMEEQGLPVRIDLLKARQWGGSTCVQIKMAHKQLVLTRGANSIIVGHVKDSSTEVKDMYFKVINRYPTELLYEPNEEYNPKLPPIHGTSSSANLFYIDSRNCKLKLGSAERPESARGGDSTLAHCTEVAMWVATDGKTPEDIVRSVTGGILYKRGTAIVYESTANGSDNFFHDEYMAAKEAWEQGVFHQFWPLFISWYEIGWKNMLPFKDDERYLKKNVFPKYSSTEAKNLPAWFDIYLPEEISESAPTEIAFAKKLLEQKDKTDAEDNRHEPGKYLWWLWEKGATLEAIYWYTIERTKFHDHADMAAEAPSDDVEAFKHSGARVFSEYSIHELEAGCKPPRFIGEVDCLITVSPDDYKRFLYRPNEAFRGREYITNLRFCPDETGNLWVWDMPERYTDCIIKNRYLVSVDIGGMSERADWSVITVLDRYWLMEGGTPIVVAQWRGHIDHDILAIKAAQIAAFYNNALLVIESNTLEVNDRERDVDGDQSGFILNQIKSFYPNLYERQQDEESVLAGMPHKYGFHTNARTKPVLIAHLQKCLRDKLYVERDKRCLDEFSVYQKLPNGAFAASKGHHDDMLMSRAIALYISYCEMDYPREIQKKQKQIAYSPRHISSDTSAII